MRSMPRKEQMEKAVTFYFPTKDILDEWKKSAGDCNSSLNNYIFEMALRGRTGAEQSRPDLTRENSDLEMRNRKLEDEVKILKKNTENMQAENYKLRFEGFLKIDSEGQREYDAALVAMLKGGRVLDSQEILAGLGIDPRDGQAVKLVSNQLEELRRFGLVREGPAGWRWL